MKNKSSKNWIKRHLDDPYVQASVKDGYRSRAAYKLLEIQEKYPMIKKGSTVVDLGAAPGSWSQVAQKIAGPEGKVIALDRLEMAPMEGVTFIQGDFEELGVYESLIESIGQQKVALVMSDMAPNLSGVKSVDQAKSAGLVELALDLAFKVLERDGHFLCKVFQGRGIDGIVKEVKTHFEKMHMIKPPASRARSSEMYLLGWNYRLGQ